MTQNPKQKGKSIQEKENRITLHAIASKALDVECYRGFANLSDLARMSKSDEYDEKRNPRGTQRNLNRKHAREAYLYAAATNPNEPRIWPEIILNMRYRKGTRITPRARTKGGGYSQVKISIELDKISRENTNPTYSRVDGNHRLFFADGHEKNFPAIDIGVPFCILSNIGREQEIAIFKTINDEQLSLKTDHILRINGQLIHPDRMMEEKPELWLTTQLREKQESPFYGIVHVAGKKERGSPALIKQNALHDGIKLLLKRLPAEYKKTENLERLSKLMLNYFSAAHKHWEKEWRDPKEFILMTNTGMQALGIVGAELIQKHIQGKKGTVESFLEDFNRCKNFSWRRMQGTQKLPTGRSGGEIISQRILEEISTRPDLSFVDLAV